ncbi:unnamed protein product [Amoebophrya sp. A25]|nr:unnamed protein product [Amoebophrya sp. A25]|eukprot:GSA25T00007562001.1
MTTSTVPSSQYEWALQALWDNKFFFLLVAYFIYKHVVGKQPFPEHPGHKVTNLSSVEEWKKFLDSNKKCVVDYYATWCYPCRACSVAYGQLSEEYDPKGWKFAKVDIDLAKDVLTLVHWIICHDKLQKLVLENRGGIAIAKPTCPMVDQTNIVIITSRDPRGRR